MPCEQSKVNEFITPWVVGKIIQNGPDHKFWAYQAHPDALEHCDWRVTKNQIFKAFINAGLVCKGFACVTKYAQGEENAR